jgi:hypothetical protein
MSEETKYRHSFPIRQYLDQHYSDGIVNSTGQFVATCHKCESRGLNGKNKFYYNLSKLSGLCQRCWALGDGGGFKSIAGLIMFTEDIDYRQAIERIKSMAVVDDMVGDIIAQITEMKRGFNIEVEDEDYWNIPINVDIPQKIEANKGLIRKFFSSRNRPMTMKILKLFPAFMSRAEFLQKRLVFIIKTNNSYAWLGYSMEKNVQPKTLNPRGNILSYMLGGYNYFRNEEDPLIIVEGLFDMFRCILRGYHAVCSFSDKLSARQVSLINDSKANEIILCYDSEVTGEGWKAMYRMLKRWKGGFSKPLSFMFLPLEGRKKSDADDVSKQGFNIAYKNRKRMTA